MRSRLVLLLVCLFLGFTACKDDDAACPVGAACDDNNPCTEDDQCDSEGQCRGIQKDCSDGVDCTLDGCQTSTGECVHDDSACGCAPGIHCDDGNPCTDDTCDATGDCVFTVNVQNPCTDFLRCTDNDACQADGYCVGEPILCDDSRDCTLDQCDPGSGQCIFDTADCECATPLDCDDSNPCTIDTCDATSERCQHEVDVLAICDDGDLCTHTDVCQVNGTCDGSAINCDDQNPCTDDACNPADGLCELLAVENRPCDDADPCTVSDQCQATGDCEGTSVVCDDSRACTIDTCEPQSGTCLFDTANCACTVHADCDDLNPCTDDSCDVSLGTCDNVAVPTRPCSDGSLCTMGDECQSDGTCLGSPVLCDSGDPCRSDYCNPANGQCAFTPNTGHTCNDNNACTSPDTCSSSGVCAGNPIVDNYEPNYTLTSAVYLGATDDNHAFPQGSLQASLYPSGDADAFKFQDNDTPWGAFHPRAELSNIPAGSYYNLCIYFDCDNSASPASLTCISSTSSQYGILPGCCSTNSGWTSATIELDVNCPGTTNESGTAYVRVSRDSGTWTCNSYTLEWGDN